MVNTLRFVRPTGDRGWCSGKRGFVRSGGRPRLPCQHGHDPPQIVTEKRLPAGDRDPEGPVELGREGLDLTEPQLGIDEGELLPGRGAGAFVAGPGRALVGGELDRPHHKGRALLRERSVGPSSTTRTS